MCDPAIVTYSSASAPPSALPAFSSSDRKAPAQAPPQAQSGAEAAPATSEASSAAGKANPKAPEGSQPKKPSPSHPSGIPGSNSQHHQTHQDPSALQPRPPGIPNNKKLPKPFENIMAQLQSIFPNYSRYGLKECWETRSGQPGMKCKRNSFCFADKGWTEKGEWV